MHLCPCFSFSVTVTELVQWLYLNKALEDVVEVTGVSAGSGR